MTPKKPPSELLSALADPEGLGPEEIRAELGDHGIDLDAATERFRAHLRSLEAQAKRRRLDEAKRERESWRPPLGFEAFKAWAKELAPEALMERIRLLEGALAHRDFTGWSRESLEAHLFDLETLKARDEDGQE